jgi:DNA-binding transcriptional LysR family regulator
VVIGANEAAVHSILPIVERFTTSHPSATIDVRRVPSRQIASEILARALDFGVLTFQPPDKGLQSVSLGSDELVMLAHPGHALARKKRVTIEEVGRETVIAHNDPSPARERVLRLYERRHAPINIQIALPSLDGIKRAVEMGLGVAVLPRRCALTEIARGDLVAVKIPELSGSRTVRLVFRRGGEMTRAAAAFLELTQK